MDGQVKLMQGDARHLDLPDNSVDLIVTSPPFFGLRSYQDGGEHYQGQVGDEATPAEFIDALIECTRKMMRVTKPTGSIWVNLGDKYSQRVALRQSSHQDGLQPGRPGVRKDWKASKERGEARMPYQNITNPETGSYVPEKSLMGIPWRYAIRCIDELGLILRAEVIWAKPNGLPESVKDRVRRSHEQWFHFTLEPRYYSSVDAIREPHKSSPGREGVGALGGQKTIRPVGPNSGAHNIAGKLPDSVRTVATEPLRVPDELGVDHYAAFPTAWPRWIIQGWSPENGVVLDPFGGTGTTALVASVLGRTGISNDMSADYTRIAQWRTTDPKQRAKAAGLKYKQPPKMRAEKPLFETEGEDSCRG